MSSAVIPSALVQSPAPRRVFGARPFHVDGDLLALAFGPDGSLWTIEDPGVLRRWDPAARRQLDWRALDEPATLWCFSGDARFVAAGSDEITVWETGTGEARSAWPVPLWSTAMAFGPGGLLATGHDDGSVRLWDWDDQKLLRKFDAHHLPVSALSFSVDGKRLATASEDRTIRFWDVDSARPAGELIGHTDRIPALAWHPDGKRFYSAGWDTTARVWDVASGAPIILLNSHAAQVHAMALSPDGGLLACADSAFAVHLWETAANRTMKVLPPLTAEVRCLAFSPDGQSLALGGADRIIHVHDRRGQSAAEETVDPLLCRTNIAVSPDGRRLFSLGSGTPLRIWDTATGQPAGSLAGAGVLRAFAAAPDGRRLVVSEAREDEGYAVLGVYDAASGQQVVELDGQRGPVTVLAVSADGKTAATGGYQSSDVRIWDVDSGEPTLIVPGAAEDCSVEALAFHPQGRYLAVGGIDYLATGGNDGRVSIWDVRDRHPYRHFAGGALAVAFHPSGERLATAGLNQVVRIWDVAGNKLLHELRGHLDAVTGLAYSPDGRLLASGGHDRTVRFWDVDGRLLAVVEIDTQVKALAFSPDGRRLFTGNANTSCYLLDVPVAWTKG
jgi:WD40 repeat protein